MKIAELHADEEKRLEDLYRHEILDSDFEQIYQEIAELAASICGTQVALISFVDADRQWFKAKVGLETDETPRDNAFCAHAILEKGIFQVANALEDERFFDNPLVLGDPKIRFYAGCPIISEDGFPLGTLCTLDDKPKQLTSQQEQSLRVLANQVSSQLKLRRANLKLREQKKHLESMAENRNRFFKIIAHDLRAPFQGLLSITETLDQSLESFSDEQIHGYLGLLRNSTGATYGLLENLLKWSMLETASIPHKPVVLPALKECERATAVLQSMIDLKDLKLECELNPKTRMYVDRDIFDAILRNIVSNAIKFTPAGGTIKISARAEHSALRFTVQDSGIGMTEQARQKLFSEEYSTTFGTNGEKGTGLGFSLVRRFVELLEGRLEVRSTPGCGTIVSFSVPSHG